MEPTAHHDLETGRCSNPGHRVVPEQGAAPQHGISPQHVAPSGHCITSAHRIARRIALDLRPLAGGTGLDVDELQAEALLGWAEAAACYDARHGATAVTHAWLRMQGRPRDRLRRERRQGLAQAGAVSDSGGGDGITPSQRLAVRQAVERARPQLDQAAHAVLDQGYFGGASLREIAQGCGLSQDALHRAHQRLLRLLRAELEPEGPSVQTAATALN